ncbi:MAG: prohibitin family protein [bacterium]|nr:prohibitin family protein [Candidatus Kapabacteria bacterium]
MNTLVIALLLAIAGIVLVFLRRSTATGGDIHIAQRNGRVMRLAGVVAFALALVVLAGGSFVTIEPGEIGVKVFFGRVESDVLESGFHLVNPLTDIVRMDGRTQAYTMSGRANEGAVVGDDAIEVLSRDGLALKLEVTVQYHLTPSTAPKVYKTLANDYVERVVRPETRSALRDAAVGFQSTDLYAARRADFVNTVRSKLTASFNTRGIALENVLLRDVQLPPKVREAIDVKISAEQEAQKMQYVLQRERQEAERKRVEAAGISDAQRIIASSLTAQYLQYNYISTLKELVNSKNATFVITPFDQKLTPMLNMNPAN